MDTKTISFSNRELTYLIITLVEYKKKLLEKEPDGWYEDLLMTDFLVKKIKGVK